MEGKGSLTFKQIWSATETNRNVLDPTGWTAEKLEWIVTWCVCAIVTGHRSSCKPSLKRSRAKQAQHTRTAGCVHQAQQATR